MSVLPDVFATQDESPDLEWCSPSPAEVTATLTCGTDGFGHASEHVINPGVDRIPDTEMPAEMDARAGADRVVHLPFVVTDDLNEIVRAQDGPKVSGRECDRVGGHGAHSCR